MKPLRISGAAKVASLTGLSADWFWETDAEHRLQWIAGGQPVLKLFGAERAYGRRIWDVPGLELASAALDAHLEVLAARAPFHELELRRRCADGSVDFHLVSGEPCYDEAGGFAGYRGVGRDVSEQRRAGAALAEAKDRLELAVEAGDLAIWDSDVAGGRVYLSDGWKRMLGKHFPGETVGLDALIESVHPQDLGGVLEASRRCVKGELPLFSVEMRVKAASGEWKWLVATGRVTQRDARGWTQRMSGVVVDVDRRKRAEQATRDAEARYRNLIELSPDGVLVQCKGVVEYANPAAARLLGAANAGQLIGHNLMERVEADHLAAARQEARYLNAGPGQTGFMQLRMRRYDDGVAILEAAGVSYLERGRLVVQTVLRDMSAQIRAQTDLAEREQRFRDVVEAAGEYVWETDADFRYTWLSDRIEAVLGHMRADMLGRRPQEFMPLGEVRTMGEKFARFAARREPFRDLVHRSITKSGRVIWQSVSGVPVLGADGALKGYRGTGADITARRQAEERIQFLATRDALTGLPNRLLLADRAGQALINAHRNDGRIAVLSFDLDRFQLVNDTLGHQVGDALLRAIAERLSTALRRDDTLARLGGDEFVLLWDGTREVQDVALVAQKVLGSLAQPFNIEGRTLGVSASVGISVFPGDGRDFSELLKNADAAMYSAKESGGNAYRFFSPDLNARAVERLAMENDLRTALARDEFVLHYQPVLRGSPGARVAHRRRRSAAALAASDARPALAGRFHPAGREHRADRRGGRLAGRARLRAHRRVAVRAAGRAVVRAERLGARVRAGPALRGASRARAARQPPAGLAPAPGDRRAQRAGRARRQPGGAARGGRARRRTDHRRFRRGAVQPRLPAQPAAEEAQDRQLLRARPGHAAGRRGHRADRVGDGARPGAGGRRRGRGELRAARAPGRHGLPRMAGPPVQRAARGPRVRAPVRAGGARGTRAGLLSSGSNLP
jgi:diguanylate cyclase (GGDEF)-like protein/PAS domain S-box-containing protein